MFKAPEKLTEAAANEPQSTVPSTNKSVVPPPVGLLPPVVDSGTVQGKAAAHHEDTGSVERIASAAGARTASCGDQGWA